MIRRQQLIWITRNKETRAKVIYQHWCGLEVGWKKHAQFCVWRGGWVELSEAGLSFISGGCQIQICAYSFTCVSVCVDVVRLQTVGEPGVGVNFHLSWGLSYFFHYQVEEVIWCKVFLCFFFFAHFVLLAFQMIDPRFPTLSKNPRTWPQMCY